MSTVKSQTSIVSQTLSLALRALSRVEPCRDRESPGLESSSSPSSSLLEPRSSWCSRGLEECSKHILEERNNRKLKTQSYSSYPCSEDERMRGGTTWMESRDALWSQRNRTRSIEAPRARLYQAQSCSRQPWLPLPRHCMAACSMRSKPDRVRVSAQRQARREQQ